MDASDHYRRAEELAAKASEYLGQGDGQDSALAWAAVAQVHATLALSGVTGTSPPDPSAGQQRQTSNTTSTTEGRTAIPWPSAVPVGMESRSTDPPPPFDVEPDDPDDET